jgi:PAS domain-containing protein
MMSESTGQVLDLTFGAIALALYVGTGATAMRSLRRRGAPAAAAVSFGMSGWIACGLVLKLSDPVTAAAWDRAAHVFSAITPWFAFWGAVEVAGLRPRGLRWLPAVTAVPLFASVAVLWPLADNAHLVESVTYQSRGLLTYAERTALGPLVVPIVGYSYGLALAAVGLFTYFMMTAGRLALYQGLALVAGLSCALVAHALHAAGLLQRSTAWMNVGFAMSGVFFYLAVSRRFVLELAPVSRHRLFDAIGVGVVAVDRGGHVVDLNPAMATLCGVTLASALGRRFVDLLAPSEDLKRLMVAGPSGMVLAHGEQQYAVQAVRLLDARGNLEGHVYLFQDETERRRAEGDREQLIAQLREATLLAETTIPVPYAALHSVPSPGQRSVGRAPGVGGDEGRA